MSGALGRQFGKRPQKLRQERNWTQVDLAFHAGLQRVVHVAIGTWSDRVIDSGILAYSESPNQVCAGIACGDFVQGEIVFGVDPFFYFERLWKLDGIPPLIHEWRINSIEQETTPLILSETCGRQVWVRDERNRSFGPVQTTVESLASYSEIGSEYVLHCTKLDRPPLANFVVSVPSEPFTDPIQAESPDEYEACPIH